MMTIFFFKKKIVKFQLCLLNIYYFYRLPLYKCAQVKKAERGGSSQQQQKQQQQQQK